MLKNKNIFLIAILFTLVACSGYSTKEYENIKEIGVINLQTNEFAFARLFLSFGGNFFKKDVKVVDDHEEYTLVSDSFNPKLAINNNISLNITKKSLVFVDATYNIDLLLKTLSDNSKNPQAVIDFLRNNNKSGSPIPDVVLIVIPNSIISPYSVKLEKGVGFVATTDVNVASKSQNGCIVGYRVVLVDSVNNKLNFSGLYGSYVEGWRSLLTAPSFWDAKSNDTKDINIPEIAKLCTSALDFKEAIKDLYLK